MPSNRKSQSIGYKQLKNSVNKEPGKRLKKGQDHLLRQIGHKNSFGNSNWNNFLKMENPKLSHSAVAKKKSFNQQQKLRLMKSGSNNDSHKLQSLQQSNPPAKITKMIAIDCEMVGVGQDGSQSLLGRVSLVNSDCECIYDKYVKPTIPVTDYRTFVSGIRPHDLEGGEDFLKVQSEVAKILKDKILIGHSLKHDLEVLMLKHPRKSMRDTTSFTKFRNEVKGTMSLKNLTLTFLGVKIQDGEHDSIEDARAAMQLYMTYHKEWEKELREKCVGQIVRKNFAPVSVTADDV